MPYSPKYVTIDEIPVRTVPDDYSEVEKEDALEFAEASLELDINNGNTIPDSSMVPLFRAAIKIKATCELVKGTEDPTDVRLGDVNDDGTNKGDYANLFCEEYDELIEKINSSDLIDDPDLEIGVDPYVYNTKDPSP